MRADLRSIDRRTFLADLGRGAFALAVVTAAGCSPATLASLVPSASPAPETPGSSGAPPSGDAPSAGVPSQPPGSPPLAGRSWARVNLGFVSAYVLVREGEAAVVDTGVAGSADAIETTLGMLGLTWSVVGNVILTHWHGDHAGSIGEVMRRADAATGWAGERDIPRIGGAPRALSGAAEGDRIFDLEVIETPGHTSGSISVIDAATGVLVAGDALRTNAGLPALPPDRNTQDPEEAKRSAIKLGRLTFETLLVGHGDPIPEGASALVAELAGS